MALKLLLSSAFVSMRLQNVTFGEFFFVEVDWEVNPISGRAWPKRTQWRHENSFNIVLTLLSSILKVFFHVFA